MSNDHAVVRVNLYVDGFNLYHAIDDLGDPQIKWLNLQVLGKSLLKAGEALGEIHYFTAIVPWDSEKSGRHRQYIRALETRGVIVTEGNFRKAPRRCPVQKQMCDHNEEKQTDVAIAVQMLCDAMQGNVGRIILVTADSDQIPTVKAIIRCAPHVELTLAAPPGRMKNARELGNHFLPSNRTELTAGRLKTCLFPKEVRNSRDILVAVRPIAYEPKATS